MPTVYSFDHTGSAPANKIIGEQHVITSINNPTYHFIVPKFSPFFANGLVLTFKDINNVSRPLVEGIDFILGYQFIGASRSCAKPIYGAVSFLNLTLTGIVTATYQTIGGDWTIDSAKIDEILSDEIRNPRTITWEQVVNLPSLFPVIDHQWNLIDLVGMSDVVDKLDDISLAIANKVIAVEGNTVTKLQVGLGNVDNHATATDQETIDGTLSTKFTTPHSVSAALEYKANHLATSALLELNKLTGASKVKTITGKTLDNTIIAYSNLNDLKTAEVPDVVSNATIVSVVFGRGDIGDGDVRYYVWDRYSLLEDNGVSVLKPSSNPPQGRWVTLNFNKWKTYRFIATANQQTYTMDFSPIDSYPPKIFVNSFIELVHKLDFEISNNKIYFHYELRAGDEVDISQQISRSSDNTPDNWVYKKFTVTNPTQTFVLDNVVTDSDSVKVILNDLIVLHNNTDFLLNGIYLNIIYPIQINDTVEIVSLNSAFTTLLGETDSKLEYIAKTNLGSGSGSDYVLTKQAIINALGYVPKDNATGSVPLTRQAVEAALGYTPVSNSTYLSLFNTNLTKQAIINALGYIPSEKIDRLEANQMSIEEITAFSLLSK